MGLPWWLSSRQMGRAARLVCVQGCAWAAAHWCTRSGPGVDAT
jgi:hypothetical protein